MQQHAFVFYNLYFTSTDKPHTMNAYSLILVWEKTQNRTGLKPEYQSTELFLGCMICSTVAVQVPHTPKLRGIHRPHRGCRQQKSLKLCP